MRLLWVRWGDVFSLSLNLAKTIAESGYVPDVVVGILRGGYIVGRIISDALARPIAAVEVKFYKGIGARGTKPIITQPIMADMAGKKVLIVDDVVESGRTLEVVTELCSIRGASAVRTAALYVKPWAMMNPDYYAAKVEEWVVFPWEVGETLRELRQEGESFAQAMRRLGAPYDEETASILEAIERASADSGSGEGG